jgi:type I restriction enzyme S subunit
VSFTEQLDVFSSQTTIKTVTVPQLNQISIPRPPRDEQESIAAYLADAVPKIDKQIKDVEKAIVLLLERRSALISAAVTGKIDVRHLFPQETEAA